MGTKTKPNGKRHSRRGGYRFGRSEAPPSSGQGRRQLVVIAYPDVGSLVTVGHVRSNSGIGPLAKIISSEGIAVYPLFGPSEDVFSPELFTITTASGVQRRNMTLFYRVEAPDDRLEEIAERFRQEQGIQSAYIKPGASSPVVPTCDEPIGDAPPTKTPNFTLQQGYLKASPTGVGAEFAASLQGGAGSGVRIVDVEQAWRFSHEDLRNQKRGVIGGVPLPDRVTWRSHGTAVLGILGADPNDFGVTGICSDARIMGACYEPQATVGTAAAIKLAADSLSAGDIILLEMESPGPLHAFIPVEWWPCDLAAIQYAVGKGLLVVEAAGNGTQNLDDAEYDKNPTQNDLGPFPADWRNPFRRGTADSGAIVVGAGAAPINNPAQDRSRLDFSNYGSMVDAQGWGEKVTTCGYGCLQGTGNDEDRWYTYIFAGTSSAAPMVAGALACVQGVLKAKSNGLRVLTPIEARNLLRTTGSPQPASGPGGATERIGNQPDIKAMLKSLGLTG